MKNQFIYLLVLLLSITVACTEKVKTVTIKFSGAVSGKNWAIKELNPRLPLDWSPFGFLTFDMYSTTTQRFDIRLYDSSGVRRLTVHPFQGARVRASIPLVHFQKRNTKGMDMAAIGQAGRPGFWLSLGNNDGTITHVDSLGVSMRQAIDSQMVEISNVRLTMNAEDSIFSPIPLVDEFGQWIPAEWPGKAKTIEDLKSVWEKEDNASPVTDMKISKYGGFLDKKVKATGFFRVEKVDGKWWFVDPDGYLFYSTGSCGIRPRVDFARVETRKYVYKEMPPAELAGIPTVGGAVQNSSFYTWNLFRRFGTEWNQKWIELTVKRMGNWGINTVGNWSDTTLEASKSIPYSATLSGWGIETGVMGLPDIYGADYVSKIDAAAKRQCAHKKTDPYLLGYFIGNEQPWPGREAELTKTILEGPETPMQTELKKFLADGDTPERRKTFAYNTFIKFIGIVNTAIKKYDPNHLNLGIRFGGPPPDEIIKASKGNFDVYSMNNYGYNVNQNTLNKVYDLTGLPIIIGEFHFGTPGRGLAPGLAQTKNQEERGVAYQYYVENGAVHPALIGTHWFIWVDQPPTGRGDGENYNIGIVDVTDRPYTEMVNATKETFKRLYGVHSGKIPPVTRKALVQ